MYPIMAGDQEMVCSVASIPERVFIGDDADVISDDVLKLRAREGDERIVNVADDIGDADGDEEYVSFVRIAREEVALSALHFIDELTFDAVDVNYRADVY